MLRPLTSLSAVALLLIPAPAAPVPKERLKAEPYHPTRIGAKQVYDTTSGERTFVVTAVESRREVMAVTIATVTDGREGPCQVMEVSGRGVFRLRVGESERNPPECLLKLPHRCGEQWTFRAGPEPDVFTAVGTERVEVPAGAFTATRVERQYPTGERDTYWFAPSVGLIKVVQGEQTERVLRAFTPGKD